MGGVYWHPVTVCRFAKAGIFSTKFQWIYKFTIFYKDLFFRFGNLNSKGLAVYELVKDQKISQPLLTGEWEQKLEEIRSGLNSLVFQKLPILMVYIVGSYTIDKPIWLKSTRHSAT
jgi:hypothetical protein